MTYTTEQLNRIVEEANQREEDVILWNLETIPEGWSPTVGGSLDLSSVTSIPEGWSPTVGGSLYLSSVTSIPEGWSPTVGGSLDLSSCSRSERRKSKVQKLTNGTYKPGEYLYADGVLTHVRSVKQVGQYTVYVGKIPGHNVVSNGTHYAHCDSLRQGIADLAFKASKDRGAAQYQNIALDAKLTVPEMVAMYRVITGACSQGSERFVQSLGQLKEHYTVREAIELTNGQYGAQAFADFFKQ